MKKLSKKLGEELSVFLMDLSGACENARDYYDNKSETWQASDAGTNYCAWVEQLEAAVEALESLPEEPGS